MWGWIMLELDSEQICRGGCLIHFLLPHFGVVMTTLQDIAPVLSGRLVLQNDAVFIHTKNIQE